MKVYIDKFYLIVSLWLFLFAPNVSGGLSTGSAIQSAINACPANQTSGCSIEIDCGVIILSSPLYVSGRHNVLIKGCGMNGTTLQLDAPTNGVEMFKISNSRWITIQDLKIHFNEQHANSISRAVEVSNSLDVTFERVHFHAEKPDAYYDPDRIGYPVGLYVRNTSKRVFVSDSRFHSSGKDLVLQDCSDCWISGSWFGSIQKVGVQPTLVLGEKRGLGVVRFENNTFDMLMDVNENTLMGLTLERADTDKPGTGAQVVGNSFINIGEVSGAFQIHPLRFYGYSSAVATGNLFRCVSTAGCKRGIRFSNSACTVSGCNERNLITNNQFIDYVEMLGDAACAIWLSDSGVSAHPSDNVVDNNVINLDASGTGSNVGVCGNTSGNFVGSNYPLIQ